MSFSAEWLALREPVDHRSINVELRAQVAAHLSSVPHVRVMDMGCGSGSNLRALADHLGHSQHWTLVDWDENLLSHAREAISAWGENARDDNGVLHVTRGDKQIAVSFQRADLARHVAHELERPLDFVTAAAFFDLVSEDWMDGFAAALAVNGAPLYTTLTYNGVERWGPPHGADELCCRRFTRISTATRALVPRRAPALRTRLCAVSQGRAIASRVRPRRGSWIAPTRG